MGYPITSLGTLLDEPQTGVVYLEGGLSGKDSSAVNSDFNSLRGKRIGFVGHFGKIQIDELFQFYKVLKEDGTPDYTPVRCGMQIADSILNGTIDAGESLLRLIPRRIEAETRLLKVSDSKTFKLSNSKNGASRTVALSKTSRCSGLTNSPLSVAVVSARE